MPLVSICEVDFIDFVFVFCFVYFMIIYFPNGLSRGVVFNCVGVVGYIERRG